MEWVKKDRNNRVNMQHVKEDGRIEDHLYLFGKFGLTNLPPINFF